MSPSPTEPPGRESKRGERLDPDALAALEEERDFLLRSIADLEREHEAGDIDDDDFRELSDGYTARTAEVLRAITEQRAAFDSAARPASRGRTITVVAGILAVGILAGVLVSQASGRREAGETITGAGAVPRTATQDARDCVTLTSSNKIADAVACYRKVLDRDPKNPTALTYLGWTLVLTSSSIAGDTGQQAFDTGKAFIAKAVAADPTFPDAYAFTAIVADRDGRVADAKAALDKLDKLNPPADISALTDPLKDKVEQELRAGPTTTIVVGPTLPAATTTSTP